MLNTPLVVSRMIWSAFTRPVIHNAPSGPTVMPCGCTPGVGTVNSVTVPLVVIRPTWSVPAWVNHNAPSGPLVMKAGSVFAVGMVNSVIVPEVVIRADLVAVELETDHSAPSGPTVDVERLRARGRHRELR